MAEEKPVGAEGGDQSQGTTQTVHPEVLPSQGPPNSIKATVDSEENRIVLQYSGPIKPEEYQAEEFATAIPDTVAWKSAWLRAVALAWSDEKLKKELCDDAYTFIQNYCGYAIPKAVQLVVVPDTNASFDRNTDQTNSWEWHLTRSVLVMYLPNKPPGTDASDALVALSAYQLVGLAYPFTACC